MGDGESVSLTVSTAAGMRALGRSLATALRAGDLVILSGGLGAGKTTLTQGIGAGLGVRGPVTSPTFVIARVHPPAATAARDAAAQGDPMADLAAPRPALVHADAYRLGSALELDDLDLDTDTASSVTVVEWGEGMAEGLATDRLEIAIAAVAPPPGPPAGPPAADAAGEIADPAVDMPRTVRISLVGARWEGVELPLANLADRL
ncbi:MAG TPA: tRNA (adenosine(37)-N6)-threonylcarbamoyltransferase complex ATPase subunit type 1 TsaE [Trebonia sp.]